MVRLIGGEVGVVADLFVVCIVVIDDTIVGAIADVVFVAVVSFSVLIIEFIDFKDITVVPIVSNSVDAADDAKVLLLMLLLLLVILLHIVLLLLLLLNSLAFPFPL